MSALTPHIRVLRAEADALFDQAQSLRIGKHLNAALVILSIGHAKCIAADTLEEQERELEARVAVVPTPRGH